MSKEGEILEVVVSPLLKRLENVKSKTEEDIKDKLDKVEREVKEVKALLEGLKNCEKKFVHALGLMGRDIDSMIATLEEKKPIDVNSIMESGQEVEKKKQEFISEDTCIKQLTECIDVKALLEGLKNCENKFVHALGLMGRDIDSMIATLEEQKPTDVNPIMESGQEVEKKKKQEFISKDIKQLAECIESVPPEGAPDPSSSAPNPKDLSSQASTSAEAGLLKLDELLEIPTMWAYVKDAFLSLDLQEKRCMFCLLLFPENSVVKKRMLIYSWIAAGFVGPTDRSTAEENGKAFFEDLVTRCLIYPIKKKHRTVADGCVLPSKVRRKVESAARRDHFIVDTSEMEEFTKSLKDMDVVPLHIAKSRFLADQLLLFSINTKERVTMSFNAKSDPVIEKTAVLALHIGRWQRDSDEEKTQQHIELESTDFLEQPELAKNLRYLSMSGISRIATLPAESIGKLTHLMILDLRACHNLENLPSSISSLRRLTHLDVSECYLLEHLPRGISSLNRLQVLKGFVVANSRIKDPCRLHDLVRLEELRKLTISIGRDSNILDGDLDFSQWKALRSLTVTWGAIKSEIGSTTIVSHPELEKLDIRCFPREEIKWLTAEKFSGLRRLYIRGGMLAHLPQGTSSSKLEVLCIRFLKHTNFSEGDIYEAFPELTYIQIHECNGFKDLGTRVERTGMENLHS